MNFSKVKLVMILCLAVANILIGILCAGLYSERLYISEEEAELAEKHLRGLGIVAELGRDERRKYSLPIYSYTNTDGENAIPHLYKSASEVFFGRTIIDSEYVDIPGGFSVSIKNNEGETVGSSVYMGSRHFECILDEYSDTGIVERLSENFYSCEYSVHENKESKETADAFLKAAFGKSGYDIRYLGASEYNDGDIVCYGVFLSGIPSADMFVNLYVKNGRVGCLFAEIADRAPEKKYSSDTLDSVDALYAFSSLYAKNVADYDNIGNITVNQIGLMYKITETDSDGGYFIPAWHIVYDDGTGETKTALFDAIVGENKFSIG